MADYKVANMLYEGAMRLVITIVVRVLHIYCKQRLVDPITVCGPGVTVCFKDSARLAIHYTTQ